MNKYWLIFCVAILLLDAGMAWHVHTVFDEAAQEHQLVKSIAATALAQKATETMVGASDAKVAEITSQAQALKDKYAFKAPVDCSLPANSMQFLRATSRSPANGTH